MSIKEDLEISSLSYTNKDFGSLYPEVLSTAKRLTNDWDPEHSNESDPGVVLLKEAAIVADHNNYNIDKNILENFLPSATQDRSVRNITEMNGYTPRYYESATGEVTFGWKASDSEEHLESFVVPAFTFVVSDNEETVSYTQIEDLVISLEEGATSATSKCKFIEGTLQTVTINNSSTITLENLDDNNRIYLPESMVAQNGIYIRYTNESDHKEYGYWTKNNYLLTQPSGSRVFKIDYDSSRDLPYIEFPTDISSIIGDGIIINYIATSGIAGNISANTLVNIITPTEFYDRKQLDKKEYVRSSADFTLTNNGSITNGKDPETISEMYKSFKKIVGTFDTLVTCNDYSNYIYSNEFTSKLMSNCYVTDRRTEYNKALNVVTYDNNGAYFENISIKPCTLNFLGAGTKLPEDSASIGDLFSLVDKDSYDSTSGRYTRSTLYVNIGKSKIQWKQYAAVNLNDFAILTEAMSPYDLTIHALALFSEADLSTSVPYKALENSFKPVNQNTLNTIKNSLADSKCICHTFNDPDTDEVYCFKNYAPLKLTITPYNKVGEQERTEIKYAVYEAISKNFNPKNLDWGDSLDLSIIKDIIINADVRIRDVNIEPLKYETKALTSQLDNNGKIGKEYTLDQKLKQGDSEKTIFVDLIAKNILAGRVCLFEFDDEFDYEYGQDNGNIYKNIVKISTEVPIEITKSNSKKIKVNKEEVKTFTIASTGSNVEYLLNAPNYVDGEPATRKNITKGSYYALKTTTDGADKLMIKITDGDKTSTTTYTSSSDVEYSIKFDSTDLVNKNGSSFELLEAGEFTIVESKVSQSSASGSVNLDYTLKPNETVQILYPNYYSTNTYGIYVNYRYENDTIKDDKTIRANIDYTLQVGEKIILIYTLDGVQKQDLILPGSTIRTSFDLVPTDSGTKKSWVDEQGTPYESQFKQLSSNQTISTRAMMSTEIATTNLHCYWIINSSNTGDNRLFDQGETEKILNSDEYFIYTNATLDEMMILGSGTKIIREDGFGDEDNIWTIPSNDLTIESLSENGTSATIPWQIINCSKHPINVVEMNVTTLGENDNILITGWLNAPDTINNKWQTCNANITYTSNGETLILPIVDNFYKVRSRLDLAMSNTRPQQLYVSIDSESGEPYAIQEIMIQHDGPTSPEYINAKNFNYIIQSSTPLNLLGGDNVNLNTYLLNDININMYCYTVLDSQYVSNTAINIDYSKTADGYKGENPTGTYNYEVNYPFYYIKGNGREYLIPIYISGDEVTLTAKVLDSNGEEINFVDYNNSGAVSELELKGNSLYFISPVTTGLNDGELKVQLTWSIEGIWDEEKGEYKSPLVEGEYIIVDNLNVVEGLNTLLSRNETLVNLPEILSKINSLISKSDKQTLKPYYVYRPDNSMKINLNKYCNETQKAFDNPNIMWDINNVANKITIAQIDLANSGIDIDATMIKD